VSTPPTGAGSHPASRDWRAMPPENIYSLRVTHAGEVVEEITVKRDEWHMAKQFIGDIRGEQWMHAAPTITWNILARRALSVLVGASAAMVYLKSKGYLDVTWWAALAPLGAVIAARLARLWLRDLADTTIKRSLEALKK
jgi:hypothetical protein